jgi:Na+/proline symporter
LRIEPAADDDRLILITRRVAVLCGLTGALLAICLDTVVAALTIFYTLLTSALLLPIAAGLYPPRVDARSASVTIIISTGVTFFLEIGQPHRSCRTGRCSGKSTHLGHSRWWCYDVHLRFAEG